MDLLGWGGPPEAQAVRRWSEVVIAQAPLWLLAESSTGIVVPDTSETRDGRLVQRYVSAGTVLPGGNVALLMAGSSGLTRVIVTDSALKSVMDADDPDGVRHDRIPTMSPGWGHSWFEGGRAYRFGPQALLGGSFQNVPGVDSVIARPLRIVRTPKGSAAPDGPVSQQVLLTVGVLRDPGRPRILSPLPFSHAPSFTIAVSGDTIWVVPSERPELLALDRSGEVLLRVEWDAGDRTVPAGLPDWAGLERFPAASALVAGSDGRIYVQRWSVQRGYPVPGPEWLVFSPAGDLLGRVDIPRSLRVLAFGPNRALVKGTNDSGVDEVRLHVLEVR